MGEYPDYWPKQMAFRDRLDKSDWMRSRNNGAGTYKSDYSGPKYQASTYLKPNPPKSSAKRVFNNRRLLRKGNIDYTYSSEPIDIESFMSEHEGEYILLFTSRQWFIGCYYNDASVRYRISSVKTGDWLHSFNLLLEHISLSGKTINLVCDIDLEGAFKSETMIDSGFRGDLLEIVNKLNNKHNALIYRQYYRSEQPIKKAILGITDIKSL